MMKICERLEGPEPESGNKGSIMLGLLYTLRG